MIVGKLDNKQLVVVDRLRDAVRLGGGLLPDKTLSHEAWARALESLSQMGQRLRALPHHAVRAVGTNLSLIHISEPTRPTRASRMPASA